MSRTSWRIAYLLAPIVLGAAAWWCWQHAYEPHPDGRAMTIAAAQPTPANILAGADQIGWHPDPATLSLSARPGAPAPALEIVLAPWPEDALAHVRVETTARGLARGTRPWETGRITMVWRDPAGQILPGLHGLAGVEADATAAADLVAPMLHDSPPSLLIQNLGSSGRMDVTRLDVEMWRYRGWLPWAGGFLLLATWLWVDAGYRRAFPLCRNWLRRATAATLTMFAFWHMVFPGPWEAHHPIGGDFDIPAGAGYHAGFDGAVKSAGLAGAPLYKHGETGRSRKADAPGRIDAGWFWESYMLIKQNARAVLHIIVFAGLTAGLKLCLGGGMAWLPVLVIAIASEGMQYFFGFGIDWRDAGDLAIDLTGIFLGFMTAKWILRTIWPRLAAAGAPPD